MSLKLPNDKIVYNLPEQVGVNAENIKYLAEVYKEIDALPAIWAAYKETFDTYPGIMEGYATTMGEYALTMGGYATTMEGYAAQVATWTYNINAAAVSAINGATITPANLNASGSITADSIIENMAGYAATSLNANITFAYIGVVKNGNKVTFAIAGILNESAHSGTGYIITNHFTIPSAVGQKLIPFGLANNLSWTKINLFSNYNASIEIPVIVTKLSDTDIYIRFYDDDVVLETQYYFRFEITFLLSENLAS